jgi:hypothetical protein
MQPRPSRPQCVGFLGTGGPFAFLVGALLLSTCCQPGDSRTATAPFVLDHNRMLVDADIARPDGTWRRVRLWVDSGNPDFFISEGLARDLGIDLSTAVTAADGRRPPLEVPPPVAVRMGRVLLDFTGVKSMVMFEPRWLFDTMHNDANLPATVLQRCQVVLDYPRRQLTLGEPGSFKHRGVRAAAGVCAGSGIVQIDAVIDGESLSFALDSGASYSFVSNEVLTRLSQRHPAWPRHVGALGGANMWGWWPHEAKCPVVRLPTIVWGTVPLSDVGVVGLPGIGAWYSQKTARPVNGFLGANALKAFRVEIDYAGSAVYFEKGGEADSHDMDLVGLTLRLEPDSVYTVVGVAEKEGRPSVEGVLPGDRLLEVDALQATGATMGTVVDALRGKPGDVRTLVVERDGERHTIQARVERFL